MSPTLQTGRYEIIETLGCGGTSRVDKARDSLIGRTVALKSFLQGFGKSGEEQFLREAQTIGRLSHNSIAQLYDVCADSGGAPFLVMEFISGRNLEEVLAQGPVSFATAAVWAADLASALAYAHRAGIIHGDVKPSNIRIAENEQVKLVDFGVARFASQVSGSDRVLGTPAYLSPEQIEGKKQDGRSDLFSLGVVLYEMITGRRPFLGDSLGDVCAQILTANPVPPSNLNPSVPAALDRIVARCLAKNPDERYPSGNDLARALYLVARCGSKLTSQSKRPYWFLRPAHPRDLLAIAAGVLLFASAVTAGGALRDWVRSWSNPGIAAVPTKTTEEVELSPRERIRIAPQVSTPVVSAPPRKPASKTSAPKRRNSPAPVPQARAEESADPLAERPPLL